MGNAPSFVAKLSRPELEAFEELLAQKLHALDGHPFARGADTAVSMGADGFLYARCFVVAQGREEYERVLRDPSRMPSSIDDWFEPILYAASQAFEASTGDEWDYVPSVSYETGSNAEGWAE